MLCIPFLRVVCLVGLSVWYVFSVHSTQPWHTLAWRNNVFLQPFSPANAIFAGLAILLGVCVLSGFIREDFCDICDLDQAIKDISTSYDALVDLFQPFEFFLRRLDIYTKIPSTSAISEIIVKILIELLSTISLAIQQAKQGRLSKLRPFRCDN